MGWATGVMVYFVIWWTVLFTVLPLGVRRVEQPGRGQEHGAPERPDLARKAIITTILAAVLWLGLLRPPSSRCFQLPATRRVLSRLSGSARNLLITKGNGGLVARRPLPRNS